MEKKFTGRVRRKKTKLSVKAADVVSKYLIEIGGIGTIIAVSTVCLFLLWVVLPLLKQADLSSPEKLELTEHATSKPVYVAIDEYQLLGYNVYKDGTLLLYRLDNGKILDKKNLFPDKKISAFSFAIDNPTVFVGFEDGKTAFGSIEFNTTFIDLQDIPEQFKNAKEYEPIEYKNVMLQRISRDQFRQRSIEISFDDPIETDSQSPIVLIDHVDCSRGLFYAALHEDKMLHIDRIKKRKNLLTGKTTYKRYSKQLTYKHEEFKTQPEYIALSGLGDSLQLIWPDGSLIRFDTRDFDAIEIVEVNDLVADPNTTVTACQYLLGRTTLIVGDSSGSISAWFPVIDDSRSKNTSVTKLVEGHTFAGKGSPVTSLSSSTRMRMIAIGYEDGSVQMRHITSEKELGSLKPDASAGPVLTAVFAPKNDALLVLRRNNITLWQLDPRYPEITLSALFLPVWYEGSAAPVHVWQSSAATDDFEPKYGLMPLIFGTIKATIFSLLFGVPIALLAALYTSEFLHPKLKTRLKPVVEMMASLPSVVLGFLAALVFAPFVADMLTGFMTAFLTIPLMFLLGAYLWQLLPYRFGLIIQKWKFPAMFLALPAGIVAAKLLSPVIEHVCFSGNIMLWLDGQAGTSFGGWFYLLIPLCALICAWLFTSFLNPQIRKISSGWGHAQSAIFDLTKFIFGIVLTLLISFFVAHILSALNIDPRGGIFGTYVQRNALVVGFVMGFAIIPIIYTIAEDALHAVPDHLRSASLAAGATKWQTAIYITIPTAMSGLFSAIMIGLGRAVGETMIVLMAAGNTPLMEWNIFNGFRTLSANIAVELPEAVRNSTHYRTLFLAALTLFIITFILNTIAELVRMRFRKKAVEL